MKTVLAKVSTRFIRIFTKVDTIILRAAQVEVTGTASMSKDGGAA